MAPAFQKTLKFNPAIINYGRFSFLKLDKAVSLQPRILCPVINPYEHPYTRAWNDDTYCYVEGQTLISRRLHSQTNRIWLAKFSSYHWIAIFVCTALSFIPQSLSLILSLHLSALYLCIYYHCIPVPNYISGLQFTVQMYHCSMGDSCLFLRANVRGREKITPWFPMSHKLMHQMTFFQQTWPKPGAALQTAS